MEAQISITPTSVAFGNVLVGNSQTQALGITNVGTSSFSVSQVSVSGTGYGLGGLTLPYTLSPGQSVYVNVTFTPPATGIDSGSVSVTASMGISRSHHRRSGSDTITATTSTAVLSGSGITAAGQLAATPSALSFGSILPGGTQTLTETLTNSASASVMITGASISTAAFKVSGLTLPTTLASGQSLTVGIAFSPTASGSISGSLAILSNASDPQLNIALSGTGATAGDLTLTPTTMSFGNVTNNSSAALSGTLTATGSSVTLSSATSTSTEFVLSGIAFPATLAAGQSIPFSVTFLPQVSGTATASLLFVSNASSSPGTESLSGSGVAPVQHSVSLSWAASTGVTGYNVYRGGVSGGPYAQVTSLDTGLAYTDSAVSAGQTYYYVVTSVDSTGTESTYSNQVQAVIPSP
jgi:hypothetical protein